MVIVIAGVQGLLRLVDEAAAAADSAQSQLGHWREQGGAQTCSLERRTFFKSLVKQLLSVNVSVCTDAPQPKTVHHLWVSLTFSPSVLAAFCLAFFSNLDKGSGKSSK